jgi:hypothetical protein
MTQEECAPGIHLGGWQGGIAANDRHIDGLLARRMTQRRRAQDVGGISTSLACLSAARTPAWAAAPIATLCRPAQPKFDNS